MYVRAPNIHRDFIGKRSVCEHEPSRNNQLIVNDFFFFGGASPWMVSGSNMISGHLLYDDIRSLSGTPTTAIAEIVVRKLVVEFKAFKPEQDSEVLVAIVSRV